MNSFFGNGSLGDVVVSVSDPNFGGVRSYRSLVVNAGVACGIVAPLHGLILRVQDSITIGGMLDASLAVQPTNVGDLLMGNSAGPGGGGGGGGGGGSGMNSPGSQGSDGNNNQGSNGPVLGGTFPVSFGTTGAGGPGGGQPPNPSPSAGSNGGDAVAGTPGGFDPFFLQQFLNVFGWPNQIAGGAPGSNGSQGGFGAQGGFGSTSNGGPGGNGGNGGVGGNGGGIIFLICPQITLLSTAVLRTDGGPGAPGAIGQSGQDAPVPSNAGGGGGGGGGQGGSGGCAGPIILATQNLIIEPGAVISAAGGASALGAAGGPPGAGDATGGLGWLVPYSGGTGGTGAAGVAGFPQAAPGYYLIQL